MLSISAFSSSGKRSPSIVLRRYGFIEKNFQTKLLPSITFHVGVRIYIYYMAELVQGEKEQSDWFPGRFEFCYMDH